MGSGQARARPGRASLRFRPNAAEIAAVVDGF